MFPWKHLIDNCFYADQLSSLVRKKEAYGWPSKTRFVKYIMLEIIIVFILRLAALIQDGIIIWKRWTFN